VKRNLIRKKGTLASFPALAFGDEKVLLNSSEKENILFKSDRLKKIKIS
jgi:hypothetical protein